MGKNGERMNNYTWESAANEQGWKRARYPDSTYVLHNEKTGKIIDKGFCQVDCPNEAGWSFVGFNIEERPKLFNVNSERFFEPEGYEILSKPNSRGWMSVRRNGSATFYNIYQKTFSDIKCRSARSVSEESWAIIELDDGFTYANPQLNVVLQARFEKDYDLSWIAVYTEFPEDAKYVPLHFKKDEQKGEFPKNSDENE